MLRSKRQAPLLGSHRDDSFGSYSHWDVIKQRLGQLLLHRLDITFVEVCPQQSDATVDVKADTTCRTNAALQRCFSAFIYN